MVFEEAELKTIEDALWRVVYAYHQEGTPADIEKIQALLDQFQAVNHP